MSDSLITKRAISSALKTVCKDKSFDKISISDITAACGLNRQSFYYHFQDKYELLNWIYYQDNFCIITENISFDNWDEKILLMLRIMLKEKSFYVNTIKEQQHTFENYLFQMAATLFGEAIDSLDQRGKLTPEERGFYAEFYAHGICGVILNWAEKGMKMKPELVAGHLKKLAKDTERVGYLR